MFLYYATIFLGIAIIATACGFTGFADAAVAMAKILFLPFLVFATLACVINNFVRRTR